MTKKYYIYRIYVYFLTKLEITPDNHSNNHTFTCQVDQVAQGNQVDRLHHERPMDRRDQGNQVHRVSLVHPLDQMDQMDRRDQVDRVEHQWLLADTIHTLYINLQ